MRLKRSIAILCAATMMSCVMPAGGIVAKAEDWSVSLSVIVDNALRKYVSDTTDTNKDGILTEQEIKDGIGEILNIPNAGVTTLEGVEKLKGLTGVSCNSNPIKTINLNNFPNFTIVSTSSPVMNELDVSSSTINIVAIGCPNISTITWGDKSKYRYVDIEGSCLTQLDTTGFTKVSSLLMDKTSIKDINLSGMTSLDIFSANNSSISYLDLSKNSNLIIPCVAGAHLSEIDLSKNTKAFSEIPYKSKYLNYHITSKVYTPQQIYIPARIVNGKYVATISGVTDATRIKNVTSGPATADAFTGNLASKVSGNTVTWQNLSDVPAAFSYQYDTKCGNTSLGTVYLDVNVNVIRPAQITSAVKASSSSAAVTWNAESVQGGTVKYELYRSAANTDSGYTKIATTASTDYTDTQVTAGNTYYYKLKTVATVYSGDITSEFGTPVGAKITPDTATLKQCTSTPTSATINWNTAAGADRYKIYRSELQNSGYESITATAVTGNSYTDSTVTCGHTYYYKVMALKGAMEADALSQSVKISLKPAQAQNINTQLNANGSINATWNAAAGAKGYEVWRKKAGGEYEKLADSSTTSYTDTTAVYGETYQYMVKSYAEDAQGARVYGSDSAADDISLVPGKSNVTLTVSAYNKLKLSWNAAAGAAGYRVYRSTSANGTYKIIKTTGALTYTDTVVCGQTYYYKIVSYAKKGNETVEGETGNTVSGSTKPQTPGTPSVSRASGAATYVKWSAAAGATSYKVYRSTNASTGYTAIGTAAGTTYIDNKTAWGKTYYYKVLPCAKAGTKNTYGSYSKAAGIALKPLNVSSITSVKSAAYNKVKVSWKASEGATAYRVYRSTSKNGKYTLAGTTTKTTYTNSVTTGQTYYYKVRAYCKNGTANVYSTGYSPVKAGKSVLSGTTIRSLKKSGKTYLKVTYKKVSGATGYTIYRSTSKNGSYKNQGSTSGTTFTNKNLVKGKRYYYKVRAYRKVNGKKVYAGFSAVKYIVR